MNKPLTYRKPSGEWGIEGVDLSTLRPRCMGRWPSLCGWSTLPARKQHRTGIVRSGKTG